MPLVLNSSSITGLAAVGGLSSPQSNSVLQVLNTSISAITSTSSSSYSSTGLTITITPTSTSSRILILTSINGCYCATNNSFRFDLYKNGSSISYLEDILGYNDGTGNNSWSSQYLDTPATTSATTYAIFFASQTGASAVNINNYYGANNRTKSWLTVMEIAG
jgi:hypothetical protein